MSKQEVRVLCTFLHAAESLPYSGLVCSPACTSAGIAARDIKAAILRVSFNSGDTERFSYLHSSMEENTLVFWHGLHRHLAWR